MQSSQAPVAVGFIERAGRGISNLLDNCLQAAPGQSVLVIHGPDCFYDADAVRAFEVEARARGLIVFSHSVPSISRPEEVPAALIKAMQTADYTVFFHSLGSMLRFVSIPNAGTLCMTFTPSLLAFGSEFCLLDHRFMLELMRSVQGRLDAAAHWRISCPLGTELESPAVPPISGGVTGDGFTLLQFPLGSHRPMLASRMNGRLMIRWLVSTGIHRVSPFGITLSQPVCAHIENGRIVEFTGQPHDVAAVVRRYEQMSLHNTNPDEGLVINSWHAGIHPYGFCDTPLEDDVEKWITIAHHNPRMVHFHSCGDFNPGEIALPVIDATIQLDGVEYWKDGRFVYLESAEVLDLMEKYTGERRAPRQETRIGV